MALDYVRTARAKGLSATHVVLCHALRNALIPVLTVRAMQLASLLGDALITEIIFAWPDIGRLAAQAIENRDFSLRRAVMLLAAMTFVAIKSFGRYRLCHAEHEDWSDMSAKLPDAEALKARRLDLLVDWVAIPSVSGDSAAPQRMAQTIADWLRTHLGAHIIEAGWRTEPPLVHARVERGTGRRIPFYNMYDVMPAPPAGWSVDPFRGGVIDLPSFGGRYVARGAGGGAYRATLRPQCGRRSRNHALDGGGLSRPLFRAGRPGRRGPATPFPFPRRPDHDA